VIARPLEEVFEFFAAALNLELITPPWLRFRLLEDEPIEMGRGTHISYRLRLHGVPIRWVSVIEEWQENQRFVDRQVRGPYRLWRHEHQFARVQGGTEIRDRVDYALPLGLLGELAHGIVQRDLDRIFDYRAAAVARLDRGDPEAPAPPAHLGRALVTRHTCSCTSRSTGGGESPAETCSPI
jgi:ligand-binding SRPBCC domain-containing protein